MSALVGVLNVTPDSFSDGGIDRSVGDSVERGLALVAHGAALVDVGGESTRPGARPVSTELEQSRVLPVIGALAARGVTVSIDTMHAETAVRAVEAGAVVVNDVSGGMADRRMLVRLAELGCFVVLGHLRGTPATMNFHTDYDDCVADVKAELMQRVSAAVDAGIDVDRIWVDPGIGFAKTAEQNWDLISRVGEFAGLDLPLMVGVSRKSFLRSTLGCGATIAERDLPTAVLTAVLAQAGVSAIRVHDVRSSATALETLRLGWCDSGGSAVGRGGGVSPARQTQRFRPATIGIPVGLRRE